VLRQKPRKISGKKEDGACVFLRDDGCSIYEHRPDVCREYDAFTCDTFEEDHKKVEGKVKLRVLQGAKK
jgi:Fe-S-cluster containining protein